MGGRLEGRTVVVTGAANGMGRAQALAAAAEGAFVVATDVQDDAGAALEREQIPGPGPVVYRHLDVTDETDWAALLAFLEQRGGRLDGLVNNAGIAARERLPHVDPQRLQLAMDVNLLGPLFGMQVLHPLFGRGSSIVNIVSVAGLAGHVAAAYTASKWALRGLSRAAALEYGPAGIRVNAVFPGFIDTPLMSAASPRFKDAAIGQTPLGRIGSPGDVAPLVVYLLSDESSFVTGAEIAVDGGLSSHVSHKSIADAIGLP